MAKVRFRQADLQRAIRATKAAGLPIDRIEIEPATGKIIIITQGDEPGGDQELDAWLAQDARAAERH